MNSQLSLWALLSLGAVAGAAVTQEPPTRKPSDETQVSPSRSTTTEESRARLVFISAPQRRIWQGEKISLSLKDADLVEVLRSFAKLTEINLVIDPQSGPARSPLSCTTCHWIRLWQ